MVTSFTKLSAANGFPNYFAFLCKQEQKAKINTTTTTVVQFVVLTMIENEADQELESKIFEIYDLFFTVGLFGFYALAGKQNYLLPIRLKMSLNNNSIL